jgi:hypothetical protein
MTQEALKLALDYLESRGLAWNVQIALREALREHAMREVQRLGQEIEQEPVCPDCKAKVLYECVACSSNNYPPQQKPVELCQYGQEPASCTSNPMDCQCAIDAALAQPEQDHIPDARKMVTEQEPVAWGNFKEDGTLVGLSQHPEDQANWTNRKPLYTTPPQRTWVGLTESDRRLINFEWQDGNGTATEIIDLVEAKLKEKNT